MKFLCYLLIFISFRQFYRHRFFFSQLTVFATLVGNPEFHKSGTFFAKAKPQSKVDFTIFNCYLKASRSVLCLKKTMGHPYFPPWRMF